MASTIQTQPGSPARIVAARGGLARVLICGLMFAAALASLGQTRVSKEYRIKAAYLYNFAKFVEWPAQSFTNAQSPLVIGVFGKNPFGGELQAIARDHKINDRPIMIKAVTTVAEADKVHLLFFSAAEDGVVAQTLAALKGAGVLTVGESEKFFAAGGMINLVREGDKVRFEINDAAAEREGLKISAQLLKLAKPVHK